MTNLNVNSLSNYNFKEVKKISQNNQLLKQIKTTYLGGERKKPFSEATNTKQSFKKIKIEESFVLLNESNIQNVSENLIKSRKNNRAEYDKQRYLKKEKKYLRKLKPSMRNETKN